MMARDEEPCVWAGETYRETRRRENGLLITERYPQSAGNGRFGKRWERLVDPAGNILNAATSNAGSNFDPDDGAARYLRRKYTAMGFFPLRRCPVALVMAGEMNSLAIDQSLLNERPCDPTSHNDKRPCPHALQEIECRKRAQVVSMGGRLLRLREESAAEIAQSQTKELLIALTQAIAGLKDGGTSIAPPPPEPPPEKEKGARGK